ncbi:NfeD family protein [Rapidithrix thailandica]|uniref:NfeD family protein n=1 Tax=Rapidithrix thailandica TaxID=413964 RepID=A0AAW9SBY3_9BACT
MDFIKDFFETSTNLEALFWIIAVSSTGLLGIKSLLNLLGLDIESDVDLDLEMGDFSITAVLALLMAGSWTGVLGFKITDFSHISISLISAGAGLAAFFLTGFAFKKLKLLESSGNLDIHNAIGKTAEVYLSIPGARKGTGQIQIILQHKLVMLDAETEGTAIKTGEKVLIYQVEDGRLLVEKYEDQISSENVQA